MSHSLVYILNILVIAFPLSILEILMEGKFGWGSGWSKDKWYAKPFLAGNPIVKFFVKQIKIEWPLNYHITVFIVIMPIICILEYIFLDRNIVLIVACFIAILVFEDLFWFLFNWNFDSFKQLMKGPNGSIWWHKGWIRISGNTYLPVPYFVHIPFSLVLLILAYLF